MIYGELQLKISIYLLLSYHDLIFCGWSLIEQIWTATLKWLGTLFTCTRIKNLLLLVSLHLNHLFSGIHLYIINFNWQYQVLWMTHFTIFQVIEWLIFSHHGSLNCSVTHTPNIEVAQTYKFFVWCRHAPLITALHIFTCVLLVSWNSFNFCFFFMMIKGGLGIWKRSLSLKNWFLLHSKCWKVFRIKTLTTVKLTLVSRWPAFKCLKIDCFVFQCFIGHIFLLQEDCPLMCLRNWRNTLLLHTQACGKKKLNRILLIPTRLSELCLAYSAYQL